MHLKTCRRQLARRLSGLYYLINLPFGKEGWGGRGTWQRLLVP